LENGDNSIFASGVLLYFMQRSVTLCLRIIAWLECVTLSVWAMTLRRRPGGGAVVHLTQLTKPPRGPSSDVSLVLTRRKSVSQ